MVPEPNTLATNGTVEENQQLRVDVMRPGTPIESLESADILATIFANKNGDPTTMSPNNVITRGKLALDKAKGTGRLAINVPGPGILIGISKGGKSKKVKRARLTVTAAGTVQLPLKPTFAGKEILDGKGKLKTRIDVFFSPTGGTASAQTYKVTLKKTLKK